MLFFDRFVLCDKEPLHVKVNVWAGLLEGYLKISGQDFGEAIKDVFSEEEYECFNYFDWMKMIYLSVVKL